MKRTRIQYKQIDKALYNSKFNYTMCSYILCLDIVPICTIKRIADEKINN